MEIHGMRGAGRIGIWERLGTGMYGSMGIWEPWDSVEYGGAGILACLELPPCEFQ